MQKQYQDNTVVIEVVQIVIEVDNQGKQKQERYAMSKLWANKGKDKTTTCHSQCTPSRCRGDGFVLVVRDISQLTLSFIVTAAETMTIGAGSCDSGAANGGVAVATTTTAVDKGKDMNMGKDEGMGKDKGMPKDEGMGKDQGKDQGMPKDEGMGKDQGKDQGMPKDEGMGKDQGKDQGMPKDEGMGKDQGKDQGMPKDEGMGKDKSMGQDMSKDQSMDKGKSDYMPTEQDNSMSDDKSKDQSMSGSYMSKLMAVKVRRQTGGTISWIMAPFMDANDTTLIPAALGAPQPQPGYAILDDPAKDVYNEGWSSGCGY
jgi:hypothetical protein